MDEQEGVETVAIDPMVQRLYETTDAQVWAKDFMATLHGMVEYGPLSGHVDEGMMIAWFANAMETAKSHTDTEWRTRLFGEDVFARFMGDPRPLPLDQVALDGTMDILIRYPDDEPNWFHFTPKHHLAAEASTSTVVVFVRDHQDDALGN